MSSRFRSVDFFDTAGAPLPGLNVGTMLLAYVDRNGTALTPQPTITDLGLGGYGVIVPAEHEAIGAILLFDGGATARPRYQVRVVAADGLIAALFTSPTGALYSGSALATWARYDDPNNVALSQPAIASVFNPLGPGAYLQRATIPEADRLRGVSALLTAPAGSLPGYYSLTIASTYNPANAAAPVYGQTFTAEGRLAPGVRDLAFDKATGKFYRDGRGGLALTSGADAIRQAIEFKLSLLLGEWFANVTAGFPLFESVLVKSPNLPAIKDLFRSRIAQVEGVASVLSLDLDYSAATRKLRVSFTVSSDLGEISGSLTR